MSGWEFLRWFIDAHPGFFLMIIACLFFLGTAFIELLSEWGKW